MTHSIRVYDDLQALPAAYDRLFDAAEKQSFYFGRAWFQNLANKGPRAGGSLRVYALESDSGVPLAVLPMVGSDRRHTLIRTRRISALANFYTPLFTPVVAQGSPVAHTLDRFAQALRVEGWDVVDLHPLSREGAIFADFSAALERAGFVTQSYFCFGNWYLDVNGRSYEAYLAERPGSVRTTLRRKLKQLQADQQSMVRIYTRPDELAHAIAAYESVYRSSWKEPEASPEFIRGLLHLCAASGSLRLGVLYVNHEPAAAQIWIVANHVASIYKLAYDEKFARYSVGTLLTAELMRRVIDVDAVREVDYLTGDDEYKRDWMSHRRERWGLLACNKHTASGLLAASRHVILARCKHALKAWAPRVQFSS